MIYDLILYIVLRVGSSAVLGVSGTTILKKIPGIPQFSGTEREKDAVQFEQWLRAFSNVRKSFNEQLVTAAINKSCVGDVANAIFCLPPVATLDDIIDKFKWLCRSVESFDTLMQEFYRIVQGKNEKVQTFVLPFGKGSKGNQAATSLCHDQGRGCKTFKRLSVSWAQT